MKKILASVLCICMVLSSVVTFAAVDESYKAVLEIVKTRIPDTMGFDDFSVAQRERNGVKTYSFSWNNTETGDYMNVECLGNGIITMLSRSDDAEYEIGAFSSVSKEVTLNKAIEAFEKLNPDIKDKVVISHSSPNKQLWEERQSFKVKRIENGLEVYGDDGHIEMDLNAEKIIYFSINWSDYKLFENPANAISLEEAKNVFSEKLGFELMYETKYKDGKREPYLVYEFKDDTDLFVNFSGDVVKCTPYRLYYSGGGYNKNMIAAQSAQDAAVEFSAAELSEFYKLDGMLSKSAIEELLKKNEFVNINDVKIESESVTRDYYNKEKYYYNLRYSAEGASVRTAVDALTGEIISYSRYKSSDNSNKEKISTDVADEIMDKALKVFCLNNFGEYKLVDSNDYDRTYHRVVNGVRYPRDSLTISVDMYSGEIDGYSKTYSNVEFPSPSAVISVADAENAAFGLYDYGLKYMPVYDEFSEMYYAELVFGFNINDFYIDPFSGKGSYEEQNVVIQYNDIDNHYAKSYIQELASYGIGFTDTEFKPDEAIVQKDFISLLIQVFYRYYAPTAKTTEEYESVYESAVNRGIISEDEIEYDTPVTRSDAAKYIVNAMGYKKVAEISGIYNCPFNDVAENKGSISILFGLGIINGDENGNFNPNNTLSRADSMIMMHKYLAK